MPTLIVTPAAYQDGNFRAVHGQSISGGGILNNDVFTNNVAISGGLPANAPLTPGTYSYSYQITDQWGSVSSSAATVISTNSGPASDRRYYVIRPVGVSPSPPPTSSMMMNPPPNYLGGQDNSGATWFGNMFGFDPEFDTTTVTSAPAPSLGTVNWGPYGGGPTPAGWFYTYTPNSGATGTDTFTLTTTDCYGKAGTSKVFVKITNAPHIWWDESFGSRHRELSPLSARRATSSRFRVARFSA
jgi:hypothetical protein